eukprot:1157419-Pelagomonas_calceolata.AAC.13
MGNGCARGVPVMVATAKNCSASTATTHETGAPDFLGLGRQTPPMAWKDQVLAWAQVLACWLCVKSTDNWHSGGQFPAQAQNDLLCAVACKSEGNGWWLCKFLFVLIMQKEPTQRHLLAWKPPACAQPQVHWPSALQGKPCDVPPWWPFAPAASCTRAACACERVCMKLASLSVSVALVGPQTRQALGQAEDCTLKPSVEQPILNSGVIPINMEQEEFKIQRKEDRKFWRLFQEGDRTPSLRCSKTHSEESWKQASPFLLLITWSPVS